MDSIVDDLIALNRLLAPYGYVSKKHDKEFVVGKTSDWLSATVETKLGAGTTEFTCKGKPLAFDMDYYQAAYLDRIFYDPNKRTVTNKVMVVFAAASALVETWPSVPVAEFIKNIEAVIESRKNPKRPVFKFMDLLPRAFKK